MPTFQEAIDKFRALLNLIKDNENNPYKLICYSKRMLQLFYNKLLGHESLALLSDRDQL